MSMRQLLAQVVTPVITAVFFLLNMGPLLVVYLVVQVVSVVSRGARGSRGARTPARRVPGEGRTVIEHVQD
jgi:hypothetical protein